jgi:phosphate starvation-inducible PhoH-like protein
LEITVKLEDIGKRLQLFGAADGNLRVLRDACGVQVSAREGRIVFSGTNTAVAKATALFGLMQQHIQKQEYISDDEMRLMISDAFHDRDRSGEHQVRVFEGAVARTITPKSKGQSDYLDTIEKYDMVFCIGPAGSGKTYLAVARAVEMLKQGEVKRVILVRPAVEAGEKLGFLPGDLMEKVNPYLRPLLDAFGDMMDYNQMKRFMVDGIIEVIPLAFMRGRTLNDAAIICDEAQNATVKQMLMLMTRLGHGSKMIVTGDDTQIDLPYNQESGLVNAIRRLQGIDGIGFSRLQKTDIVRHPLVQKIVEVYEEEESVEKHVKK